MSEEQSRPARLIALLLGAGLVVPLTWCFVRADRDEPAAWTRAASPARHASGAAATAAGPRRVVPGADGDRPGPGPHRLSMPLAGVEPRTLRDTFAETRGGSRPHEALDIPAPRGTPVLAVDDGVVRKLFTSARGGLTVYQFDREERYCYYYAHLDEYAPSLHEGQLLRKGDLVGFVGSTGNARKDAPHLHFAVTRLEPDRKWWTGTAIDPYPLLAREP